MKVQSSTIENKYLRVKSINIGACLYEVYDKQKKINLILNLGSIKNYISKNFYVGATCGRYAGRISNSKFKIKYKTFKLDGNEGRNTLHGGKIGFDRLEWKIKHHSKTKIIYKLLSKNLDQGFPGDLNSKCIFEIKNKSLIIKYQYKSNQFTHVSLTNHSYWNLNKNKKETIFNHDLKINSEKYLEVNNKLIPTGKFKKVKKDLIERIKCPFCGSKILRSIYKKNYLSVDIKNFLKNHLNHFPLKILEKNIEDEKGNVTRFLIMGKKIEQPEFKSNKNYITSCIFRVKSEPSALYKCLGGFATNQVNLTKLESFSVKNTFDQANFYLDLEGHLEQPGVKKALEELGFHTETLDILGVYEASSFRKN